MRQRHAGQEQLVASRAGTFKAKVEKRFVLLDGSSDIGTEVVVHDAGDITGVKEVSRIEGVTVVRLEDRAMEVVGAANRDFRGGTAEANSAGASLVMTLSSRTASKLGCSSPAPKPLVFLISAIPSIATVCPEAWLTPLMVAPAPLSGT